MSNVAHKEDKSFDFDFNSSQSIARLLFSIRNSQLDFNTKNELRDLVLSYTNGGRDESVRLDLERKIKSYGIEVSSKTATSVDDGYTEYSDIHYDFGTIRPHPIFSDPNNIKIDDEVYSSASVKSYEAKTEFGAGLKKNVKQASAGDDSPGQPQTDSTENLTKLGHSQQSSSLQVDKMSSDVTSVNLSDTTASDTIVQPVTAIDNEDFQAQSQEGTSQKTNTQTEQISKAVADDLIKKHMVDFDNQNRPSGVVSGVVNNTSIADGDMETNNVGNTKVSLDANDNLMRIKEIKALVNDRIGNPVKLVEINKEVGREYMSTLLDAMKRINSGQSVITAMKKLEDVFVRVNQVIDDYELQQQAQKMSTARGINEIKKENIEQNVAGTVAGVRSGNIVNNSSAVSSSTNNIQNMNADLNNLQIRNGQIDNIDREAGGVSDSVSNNLNNFDNSKTDSLTSVDNHKGKSISNIKFSPISGSDTQAPPSQIKVQPQSQVQTQKIKDQTQVGAVNINSSEVNVVDFGKDTASAMSIRDSINSGSGSRTGDIQPDNTDSVNINSQPYMPAEGKITGVKADSDRGVSNVNTDTEVNTTVGVSGGVDSIQNEANIRQSTNLQTDNKSAGVGVNVKQNSANQGVATGKATSATQSNLKQNMTTPVSLGKSDIRLKKPEDLPESKTIYTTDDNDPLYTLEVDNGLEQLLLEWPIFRKSGLFGTGPKGRNHPLFLKIAKLQIPLLLAGRFEGATQEVRQSITDYMNGWRYEQGIIYEQGEEFEHYLRRVVKHILDLQKS